MDTSDFEQLKRYLRENLSIKVERGFFTDPNSRIITLRLEGEEISSASFDVVQAREYEG